MKHFVVTAAALALLTACGSSGPKFTHMQKLSDGTGLIVYDCSPLEEEQALASLKASHLLFEKKFYAQVKAHQAKIDRLRSSGVYTPNDVRMTNRETSKLHQIIRDETKALGCAYHGAHVAKR